ncbi:hypothetical protein [uncultured Algibacter sp.]|uniref:hypothetical protein n=1 Tax=uncultured Algibacter sp. TaxID=298659 RepID=UPI002633E0B4|nr:hypothetical protein [uncultured Algibacter sp.]
MKINLLLICLILTEVSTAQLLTINVPENNFGIDESKSLIVSQIENIDTYENINVYSEITITLNGHGYNFNSIPNSIDYSRSYLITDPNTLT